MGSDKKPKIMEKTTKEWQLGVGVLVRMVRAKCRVAFDTPWHKQQKKNKGKTGNSFCFFPPPSQDSKEKRTKGQTPEI